VNWKFKDIPIRSKLVLIMAMTAGFALLLSSSAVITIGYISMQRTLYEELSSLADLVAWNSAAALTFDDSKAAEETLAALRSKPEINAAFLYDKEGHLFAQYFLWP